MTCPHASTTTVAWAFGEFEGSANDEEAHTLHVASCADCSEALEALEAVEAEAAPLAGALAVEESAKPPPVEGPVPATAARPTLGGRLWAGIALAAALVLGTVAAWVDDPLVAPLPPEPVAVHVMPSPSPVAAPPHVPVLDLDRELDELELELDALRTDPSIL